MSENTKGRRPETSHKAGAACEAGRMRCFKHVFYAIRILASSALPLQAQYQGYQFLGFTGLQAGTQPSQGYYVIIPLYYAWYDLSIYNPQGNNIFKNATEGMNLFVLPNLQVVTPFKILGANYGASVTQYVVNGRVDVAARNFSRSSVYSFGDIYLQPATLGWHLKRADITAGYALWIPTNTRASLHMWTNEIVLGTTLYADAARKWNVSTLMYYDFNGTTTKMLKSGRL